MGALCGGNSELEDYSHQNMDSQEEIKFIEAQELPAGPTGLVLTEQLELFLSCRNLPKLDLGSPSDPFVVIYERRDQDKQFTEIARTEMVRDNNNPDFSKPIIIDYHFEEVQFIRLAVYDADSNDLSSLSKHDYIGDCEFCLADLVNQKNSMLRMQIKDKKGNTRKYKKQPSMMTARAEEVKQCHDQFLVQFEVSNLEKPSWLSKPNPYLQLYRQAGDEGGWLSILRSKRFVSTQSCRWNVMKIPIQRLCNGDYSRPILIRCFHDVDNAAPVLIGQTQTTLQKLLDVQSENLVNPHNQNKVTGSIGFKKTDIIKRHGFIEYVLGGLNIELMIGIDFTGSNGDPKQPETLHWIGPPKYESPYMRAIRSVGRILQPYDSDGMIAAYGFGANINPFGEKNVSHCFNLTLTNNPTVNGVEGVLQAYTAVLSKIQLYGPTNFSEIINTCSSMASSKTNDQTEQNYVILMMVTDGVISDMQDTIDAIVNASTKPLSIIIIGVGNADFAAMDRLDADEVPLRSRDGQVMKRDIVQFVEMNKFQDAHIGALAKAVLEEVPAQITGFMTQNKLHPLRHVTKEEIQQGTMLSVYQGPNSMVRAQTGYMQNVGNQPINPFYPQPAAAQPQPTAPQATAPQYNPAAIMTNPTAPTAPTAPLY